MGGKLKIGKVVNLVVGRGEPSKVFTEGAKSLLKIESPLFQELLKLRRVLLPGQHL